MLGKANKYEKYELVVIPRSDIENAPYNPRKISDKAKAKLKSYIKTHGLKTPLNWNKRTGNLVSGHQRLSVLDMLHNGKEYNLTVAVLDEDLKDEVRDNVFMNNQDAQGVYDGDLFLKLKKDFPDLDPIKDFGMEMESINYIMSQTSKIEIDDFITENITSEQIVNELKEIENEVNPYKKKMTPEAFRKLNQDFIDKKHEEDKRGESRLPEKHDYNLTLVFKNNLPKQRLCELLGLKPGDRMVSAKLFLDALANGLELFEVEGLNE